jgi:hypothetical protein
MCDAFVNVHRMELDMSAGCPDLVPTFPSMRDRISSTMGLKLLLLQNYAANKRHASSVRSNCQDLWMDDLDQVRRR